MTVQDLFIRNAAFPFGEVLCPEPFGLEEVVWFIQKLSVYICVIHNHELVEEHSKEGGVSPTSLNLVGSWSFSHS